MSTPTFISNNIQSNSERGLLTLITGPNASGKSVYLKQVFPQSLLSSQVGQIILLAHIGSYVPANEGFTIGIVKELFCMANDGNSVIANRKFVQNLAAIDSILSLYSSRSLILIDEFGPGSDTIDGLSLFISLVLYFLKLEDCPRIFLISHYFEHIRTLIDQSCLQKIRVLKTEVCDSENITTFLYKLDLPLTLESSRGSAPTA